MDETLSLLKSAVNEIQSLRNQNNTMGARLGMFDDMMSVFKGGPPQSQQGYSPDIVWALNKAILKMETSDNPHPVEPNSDTL